MLGLQIWQALLFMTFIILGLVGVFAGSMLLSVKESQMKDPLDAQTAHAVGGLVLIVAICTLIVIGLALALTIVLLVGVHQNKRGHVKFYLIADTVCLAVMIIVFLAGIGQSSALSIVVNIIIVLINIFFLLVIRSYYYKMDDTAETSYLHTA